MDQFWQFLDGATTGAVSPLGIVLSLLLAFVLGQLFAWVYTVTHSGLSYSRTFVQSLILITVVVAMVMAVIGNSIITAVGLMGALAIIRFRNVLKDTRDMAFVFGALVVGMACGSQRYGLAVVGTTILCAIAIYLYITDFGSHASRSGFLRFRMTERIGPDHPVMSVLKKFCRTYTLMSVQEDASGGGSDYAYQLTIRNHRRNEQLLAELDRVPGIEDVALTMQEELLEV